MTMAVPLPTGPPPGVPRKAYDTTDRQASKDAESSELRQTFFGVTRGADRDGNQVLGAELDGQGWGVSRPRIHVPAYPTAPYLGTPAGAPTTWTMFYSHTFKPESQVANVLVRWAVQEASPLNSAIGEFEIRWNKGQLPAARTSATLADSWDSAPAGTKGADGSLVRTTAVQWQGPAAGVPVVDYWDAAFVSIAVWGRIRTGTGASGDFARVAPLGLHQSGIGQG